MSREAPLLFDTHVHLNAAPLCFDLEKELQSARRQGVGRFLVPGVCREQWPGLLDIARSVDGVLAAPGLHPQAAHQWDEGTERRLRSFSFLLRVLLAEDYRRLLAEAGFEQPRLLGSFEGETYDPARSGRLIVVARSPV